MGFEVAIENKLLLIRKETQKAMTMARTLSHMFKKKEDQKSKEEVQKMLESSESQKIVQSVLF